MAAAICWGEFIRPQDRKDDPATYWIRVTNRELYYQDADKLAAVIFGEAEIVPKELSDDMIAAGISTRRTARILRLVWRSMLAASPLRWRNTENRS